MSDITATLIPLNHKLYKHFTAITECYSIGKEQFCYPKYAPEILREYQTFKVYEDDVYVLTFPKTGTTWLQAIVYILSVDFDFERVKNSSLEREFMYLGLSMLETVPTNSIEIAIKAPRPRLLKLHAHLPFVPPDVMKKSKVLYVCRNVKDTITSYYHFSRSFCPTLFVGSIDELADLFMENKVPYAPYIEHVKQIWNKRHEDNVYFTTYEELQKDQKKVIEEIAQFLNKTVSLEQIQLLADYCQFDNMKKNDSLNRSQAKKSGYIDKNFEFLRKGVVGSWKSEMNQELITKIDKWVLDNTKDCPELRNIL